MSSGDSQHCRDGATQEISFPSCSKDSPGTTAWTLFCLLLHKPFIRAQTCKEISALWASVHFRSSQEKEFAKKWGPGWKNCWELLTAIPCLPWKDDCKEKPFSSSKFVLILYNCSFYCVFSCKYNQITLMSVASGSPNFLAQHYYEAREREKSREIFVICNWKCNCRNIECFGLKGP